MTTLAPIDSFAAEATRPVLLFDTADTISFQMPLMLVLLNQQFHEQYEYWSTTKAHPLDIPKKQRKWLKEIKKEPETYANLMPDWHAIDAMHRLHDAGYHIIMSSDRPADMAAITQEWYQRWDVPYDEMVIEGPESKASIIAKHGAGNPIILYDDDPRAMLAFPRDGVEVWTLRKPWTPEDFHPYNTWVFDAWSDCLSRLGVTA